MTTFEEQYGTGATYKAYLKLKPRFTPMFDHLTFELLVETYIRKQMRSRFLPGEMFTQLHQDWVNLAKDLDVLIDYPYQMLSFPHAHPMSADAAAEGKRRLGIS